MHKSKSVSLLAVRPAARRAEGSRMPRAVAAGGRLWGEAPPAGLRQGPGSGACAGARSGLSRGRDPAQSGGPIPK